MKVISQIVLTVLVLTCTSFAQKPQAAHKPKRTSVVSYSVREMGLEYVETVERKDEANVQSTSSGSPNMDADYLRLLNSIYDRMLMRAPDTQPNARFIKMLMTLSILQSAQGYVRILEATSMSNTDPGGYARDKILAKHYDDCLLYVRNVILTGNLTPTSVCDYDKIKAESEKAVAELGSR